VWVLLSCLTGCSWLQMAPELLLGAPCTSAVDIFSFGVLLWEICSGK
jgi:serine/threonine protein kinase